MNPPFIILIPLALARAYLYVLGLHICNCDKYCLATEGGRLCGWQNDIYGRNYPVIVVRFCVNLYYF